MWTGSNDRRFHNRDVLISSLFRFLSEFEAGHCVPFRFHPNVRVVLQHFAANVSRNGHEGVIRHTGFGQLRDAMMAEVVES